MGVRGRRRCSSPKPMAETAALAGMGLTSLNMALIRGSRSACILAAVLINALFSEVNPIPAKAAVSAMGFGEENLRLPLTPMEDATRAKLYEEMRKLGIEV